MATIPDLIPVRALNQVSYCPRLYYLEYVESVMPTNEFVEDGLFQHRRVNDPGLANKTRKQGDALHTRSVSLSSERLGLSGKLDLMEERGGEVQPIEYKRSSAPSGEAGSPTAYENDAIQLCAQGLLLEEEFGKAVPKGVVYYIGSKTRVDVRLDETLRAKTMAAAASIRELSARETPPEPLPDELRHRCFGCSLAPVCLPEETLFAIRHPEPTHSPTSESIGRVIPANDDGAVLYLNEPGSHVGKRSEHLVVRRDGTEINRVPISSIRQVVVFGNVQVSTQALECLATLEVPVNYLTSYGRFVAALMPAPAKNMALRAAQYRVFSDTARALALAKEVVRAKVVNQRTLLMRSLRSRSAELADEAAGPTRGGDEPAARDMLDLIPRIERATDIGTLLGLEGQAASLYFGEFGRMIKGQGRDARSISSRETEDHPEIQ